MNIQKIKLTVFSNVIVIGLVLSSFSNACTTPNPDPDGGRVEVGGGRSPDGPVDGDPLDLVNGTYFAYATDLVVKGRTRDVVIKRYYNSEDTNMPVVTMDATGFGCQPLLFGPSGRYWTVPSEAKNIQHEPGPIVKCTFDSSGTYDFTVHLGLVYACKWDDNENITSYCGYPWSYTYSVDYSAKKIAKFLGKGWDLNYNIRLDEISSEKIILYDGTGLSYVFTVISGTNPAEYNPPANSTTFSSLIKNSDGTYTITRKQNEIWSFNNSGQIAVMADRNNNCISFGYTDANLTTITDDLGQNITLDYNTVTGLLETITDTNGRQVRYVYDANGDLSRVTHPDTNDYNDLTTTYTYDSNHRLLTTADPYNNIWLANTYDTDGKVISQQYGDSNQVYAISYDVTNQETTFTDRNGYHIVYTYDNDKHILSKTIYNGNVENSSCYTTSYTYTSDGNLDEITLPRGNKIDFDYDSYQNISSVRKYQGSDSLRYSLSYDNQGFVQTYRDPENNQWLFTYDYEDSSYSTDVGNLMKITLPTVENENGNNVRPEINYEYNSYGQITEIELQNGVVIKYDYGTDGNNNGRIIDIICDYGIGSALNIEYQFTYDKYGKVDTITKPDNTVINLDYNALLKLTQVQDELGYITKYHYNKNEKLEKIQRQIGSAFSDANVQTWEYDYNIIDKLTKITNPLGYITEIERDSSDNIISVKDPEGREASPQYSTEYTYNSRNLIDNTINAEDAETNCTYDENGNLLAVTDDNNNITAYSYDFADRLHRITYSDGSYEQFTYDDSSNMTQKIKRDGTVISYTYDALNRKITKQIDSGTVLYFYYDIIGRLCYVAEGATTVASYHYDRIGRLVSATDSYSKTVGYEYNDNSQKTKLTYSDGSYITYEYDNAGRLHCIKDDNSIPVTLATFDWDGLSRLTRVTYANGQYEEFDYEDVNDSNNDNKGEHIKQIFYSPSTMYSYIYTYDKAGNITDKDYSSLHYDFTYDKIYQLTQTDYFSRNNDYTITYDGVYNRTSINRTGINGSTYTLDANGLNQYSMIGSTNLSYDDNGNLISYSSKNYEYDAENRLTAVIDGSVSVAIRSYTYNWFGGMASMCKNYPYSQPTTTTYVYDGDHIIAEYEGTTLKRKFIYGPGIDFPVIMINVDGETETKYYYFHDALGSIVALLNNSGDIVESYHYSPFGGPVICESAGTDGIWLTSDDIHRQIAIESGYGNPYMFTARRWEHYAGLYYYRARMYNPTLGRFMQPDPIGYYDSMNLYQYCLNNPINLIDPYGLKCKKKDEGWLRGFWDWIKSWLPYITPDPIGIGTGIVDGAPDMYKIIDGRMKQKKAIDELYDTYDDPFPMVYPEPKKK